MNIIALILIFATLASAGPYNLNENYNLEKVLFDCAFEFNISILKFRDKLDIEHKLAYDNNTGHCFVKCFFEKLDMFDEQKGFKVEFIQNVISESTNDSSGEYLAMVQKCAQEANLGANSCERAYRGAACFVNETEQNKLRTNPEYRYKQECSEELNIPVSELKKYSSYDFIYRYSSINSNPILHCYVKCQYEKMGAFEKNNGFQVERIYNKIAGGSEVDRSSVLAKIEKCIKDTNQQWTNGCERVFRGVECFSNEIENFS